MWEISHDFVARQLGQILHRLQPSLLRRLQTRLAPVALVAWLVLLPALAFAGPEIMERMARNALSDEGVNTPWSKELGGYIVDFGSATRPGAFARVHPWLRWIRPIRSIKIALDPELTELKPPLYEVIEPGELTELVFFGNDKLRTVDGLAGLSALSRLRIERNAALERIGGLAELGALTQLTIADNGALERIEGLAGLGALTQLWIYKNAALERIGGLAGLGALTQLTIFGNDALERIEGLAGLGALTYLSIFRNDALERIEGLAGLGALTQLWIYNNAALERIEGLADLEKVEELRLEGAFLPAALTEVAELPKLRRLMLPTSLQGTGLDRPKALAPVEVSYFDPKMDVWFASDS